ncbi:MAG TPA: CdaR family protein [Cerasibacillus sp.]|uniref:CdaR family protein n=1 Tax=Cerasibacillus sp. TaxID=2498711 RepID=UPI002F4292BB
MDNWFQSKWFVRAIALVLAVSLYFVVYTEDDKERKDIDFFGNTSETQTMEDVPVSVRINADKYVVSGIPEAVTVTVEGTNSAVTRVVKQRNFDIYVDLTKLGEGEHTVEVQYERISEDVAVFIEPKTIDIVIEERSTRKFPITVDFINQHQLPEGFEVGDYQVEPKEVMITSSKGVIDKVSIVKVFVNVAGVEEPIKNREVPIKVYDSQGNELRVRMEPENALVSAEINNPSKVVPVTLETTGKLPEGFELTSMTSDVEEVEIFGTSHVLAGIDEVKANINLSKVNKTDQVQATLDLPKGVYAPEQEQIDVLIELEQTKLFKAVPIQVRHLENDRTIKFKQPEGKKVNVTITGNEADVRNVKVDDLRISVDVEGLVGGTHQVKPIIEGPDQLAIKPELDNFTIEIN